jgi:hypothetical protein
MRSMHSIILNRICHVTLEVGPGMSIPGMFCQLIIGHYGTARDLPYRL